MIIRHLSGSREGEQQTFNDGPIVLGRNPTNQVAFDPNRDSVVSGRHAEVTYDGRSWKLRDLGSSNGTYYQGTRIQERLLEPGDIIQLGKNGPRVQFQFEGQPGAISAMPQGGPAAPEGRTLMMMMDPAAAAAASQPVHSGAPAVPFTRPVKKKGGIGKALLVVAAVFMVLLIGVVLIAVMARRANMKNKAAAVAAAKAQREAAEAQASQLKAKIAAKQQEVAQTQQTLGATQTSSAGGNSQQQDLQRQLEESQRMIEEMTRQLQQKNDAIAAAQAKPAAPKVEIRYVPLPHTKKPSTTVSNQVQPVASTSTNPPATSPATSNRPPATTANTTPAKTTPPPPVMAPLFAGKKLKKKVLVTAVPPEIPPANLPTGAARDVAATLATALTSSGEYVIGQKGQASVSIMITNYKSDATKSLDVKGTVSNASKIGGLFGKKLPTAPADVSSTSFDSAMSVRVSLYDGNGKTLLQTEPSAASADRKSKFSLAGVPFNQVVMSDTPTGDVARKVVGDAVESILANVTNLDWTTTVVSQRPDGISMGVGRTGNVDLGDVFEVLDGKRSLGRVRVSNITDSTADAELLFSPGKERLSGKTLRYLGNESPVPTASNSKSISIRSKTSAFDGPGNSFKTIRELKPGQKFQLFFTVGPWARVSDGGARFWVPLSFATISS